MNKKRWLVFVLVSGTALLQGCGLALIGAGGAAAYTTLEDRRSTGVQLDDEAIELRAGNRIGERFSGDRAHVNISSFNRAVLLTGEVPEESARDEIQKIVFGVPNVRGVTNELKIAPVTPLSSRANDAFITSKVKARFLDARRFNPIHVKVVTEAGVVYLMGVVTEKEADDAVEIARTTGGVRRVVKIFEYCSSSELSCRPARAQPGRPGPAA
jgi:osmotically-inducible protein OsmY